MQLLFRAKLSSRAKLQSPLNPKYIKNVRSWGRKGLWPLAPSGVRWEAPNESWWVTSHSPHQAHCSFLWLVAAKTLWQRFHPAPSSVGRTPARSPCICFALINQKLRCKNKPKHSQPVLRRSEKLIIYEHRQQSPAFLTYLLFLLIGQYFLAICKQ